MFIGYLVLVIAAAALIHEGGHWLTALCFGRKIKFKLAFGHLWKIPVPRAVWDIPDIERWKQQVIAIAGFGTEFLAVPIFYYFAPVLGPWYGLTTAAHFIAYSWYCGERNDFKWVVMK